MRIQNAQPIFTLQDVTEKLGVSKSLIRLWEDEFNLPKRINGTISPLAMAQLSLIHNLLNEKNLTLEDAKDAFFKENETLTNKYTMLETLKNLRSALEELREKL